MIGTTLGHYRITDKLGEGGMGEVYVAEDTRLKRRVALKLLPLDKAASQDRRERFQREAEALAALDHPNIVTIYSIDEVDGQRFITMALADGEPLDARIPRGGMDLDAIFAIAIPLAEALAAAHENGITHRDLKPANIMVADDGRVKVLDFGLAKLLETEPTAEDSQDPTRVLTQDGLAVGTVPYMSPEQVEGKAVDHRSDIFSMGVLLYEMATGERPFAGDTSASLMSSILRDQPVSVLEMRRAMPRHLGRIIHHCLEKDPKLRFQTARDLRNELAALEREIESGEVGSVSSGAVLPVSSSGTVAAAAAPAKRLPLWIGAGIILAAVAGWLVFGRGERPGTVGATDEAAVSETGAAEPGRVMTVVLPFENLGSADDEYFAAGITEEITSRLAVVEGLGVISRKSAATYVGSDKSLQQIGRELGVDYVLEGRVRWARQSDGASRVRITPQLIQVSDDTTVWSQSYDREIDDVFEIQDEIANRVAEEMGLTLLASRSDAEERPTDDIDAYHAYLKGRTYYDEAAGGSDTYTDTPLAVESFEKAVRLDPDFRLAWSYLSMAHSKMVHFGIDTSAERQESAREALERARALDDDTTDVHRAEGIYRYWGKRDYEAALAAFDRALARRPADPALLEGKAFVLRRMGREHWGESLELLLTARELDPRDPSLVYEIASDLAQNRRYAEAVEMADQLIALVPGDRLGYVFKAEFTLLWKGNVPEVRELIEMAPPGESPADISWRYFQDMRDGRYREALERLQPLEEIGVVNQPEILPKGTLEGFAYEALGEEQAARNAFQRAADAMRAEMAERPEDPRVHQALGLALSGLDRPEEAVERAAAGVEIYGAYDEPLQGFVFLRNLALVYARVGRLDDAIDLLDQLLAWPTNVSLPILEADPIWSPVREHPRFRELVEKYG